MAGAYYFRDIAKLAVKERMFVRWLKAESCVDTGRRVGGGARLRHHGKLARCARAVRLTAYLARVTRSDSPVSPAWSTVHVQYNLGRA